MDQDGDDPAEVHHLGVRIEQDQEVGGEKRHLHVHLNHPEHNTVTRGEVDQQ